jgi:hypothetical protein
MIKLALKSRGGEALLAIALSREDLQKILDGEPRSTSVGELGVELRYPGSNSKGAGAVVIFVAEEDELEERLRTLDVEVGASRDVQARRERSRPKKPGTGAIKLLPSGPPHKKKGSRVS